MPRGRAAQARHGSRSAMLPTTPRSILLEPAAQAVAAGYRVALACGGTAGHVYPALAVAHLCRRDHGAATAFFVVPAEALACRLVTPAGYEVELPHSPPFCRAPARGPGAGRGR